MKKVYSRNFVIALILTQLAFFSCATLSSFQKNDEKNQNSYIPSPEEIKWQALKEAEWADYFYYENKEFPIRYHCIRINLSDKNLSLLTYPSSESDFDQKNGRKTEYFRGMGAKEFSKKTLKEENSIITVNTAPFDGKYKNFPHLSALLSARKICGIHVADKKILSQPIEKYSAICFSKNERGWTGKIIPNQKDENFSDYDFVFGGFFQILSDSEPEVFKRETSDSRTALGLSKDRSALYILVVEGEKKSKSKGLSYPECARLMLALGATDALQMDGGSSSTLFVNTTNLLSYSPKIKNAVLLGFCKSKSVETIRDFR